MFLKCLGFFLILFVLSCNADEHPKLNAVAESFSDLECRAISLRKQRYKLADEIRFTQDTLIHTKKDTVHHSANLRLMEAEREILTAQSLSLADTIRLQLDSLMKFVLLQPEEKQQFSKVLDSILIAKGCIDP